MESQWKPMSSEPTLWSVWTMNVSWYTWEFTTPLGSFSNLGFIMFHHVSSCFIMFHHVSSCFIMFHHVCIHFHPFPSEGTFRYHLASRKVEEERNERKACTNLQFPPCISANWQIWHFKHIQLGNQSCKVLHEMHLYKRAMYVMPCSAHLVSNQRRPMLGIMSWFDVMMSWCHLKTWCHFAILRLLYQLLGGLGHSLS